MARPVLVFGATGRVGGEVTRQLLAQDVPVVAAVRDPAKASAALLQHQLLTIVKADVGDAASVTTVAKASKAERVFIYAAGTSQAALEALRDGGITHVTFLSSWMTRPDYLARSDAIGIQHRRVEEMIERLGVSYTFLRAGWFSANMLRMWKRAIADGVLRYPDANARHTAVAEEDIAAVAVRSLTTQQLDRQAVPVVGEKELTVVQLAALVSRVIGRPFRVETVTDVQWRDMVSSHLPEPIVNSLLYIYHDSTPEKEGSFTEAHKALGRPPMSAEDYLRKHSVELEG